MPVPSSPHTVQSARDRTAELLNLAYPFEHFNMQSCVPWDPKQAETEPAARNKARATLELPYTALLSVCPQLRVSYSATLYTYPRPTVSSYPTLAPLYY